MESNWQLKLDRARDHQVAYLEASRKFEEDNPVRIDAELEGKDLVLRAYDLEPIPAALSLIVGDVLHNARAALDHLVMSWAERGEGSLGRAPTESEEKDLFFPVSRIETDFESREVRLGKYLANEVIDRIAVVQPFASADAFRRLRIKGGDPASEAEVEAVLNLDLLGRLHLLNNRDKHRRILLTQWWPGSVQEGPGPLREDDELLDSMGEPTPIDPELLALLEAASSEADEQYDFFFEDSSIAEGSEIGRYMRLDGGPMPSDMQVSGRLRLVLYEAGLTGVVLGAPSAKRTIQQMLDEVQSVCRWVEEGEDAD